MIVADAWYEVRAARCQGRWLDLPRADSLEELAPCAVCGHVGCARGGPEGRERLPGTLR